MQIIGEWPSGKAPVFGTGIRGFESLLPSQALTFILIYIYIHYMAEACKDFCPRIQALENLAGTYRPETAFGYHAGSAQMQLAWEERRLAACSAADMCEGPVEITTEEVIVRGSIKQLFRKRTENVAQFECGLSSDTV
ncbi:MAG: hypothetical protein JWS12_772 [Candidatus Saccharibacteria bacterium]|nr:hypothetical protein [Candidatus Saccharibacteria bacterium]